MKRMTPLSSSGFLPIGEAQLEYRIAGDPAAPPAIVMLHEGLGSAALWGDFPDRLAATAGVTVFAYSRAGYGASSPVALPRPLSFMHDEAKHVLPLLLDAIGFKRGLLLGHSDGASIAAIYAGSVQDHRVRGLTLIAPHFITEDMGIAAIRNIAAAYEGGDLKRRLARWHKNVDVAFYGWSRAWLDPAFRAWDITDSLAYIRVPVQVVQGENDQYGTIRQLEIAQDECYCPVEAVVLPGVGHTPQRETPEVTLDAVAGFANRILKLHREGGPAPGGLTV
jgi:pimeloyl-ACP methyl ester carboxylesterase